MSEIMNKTAAELEVDIAELRTVRTRDAAEMKAIQAQLAALNAQLKTTQPQARYHKLMNQRAQLVRALHEFELSVQGLNQQITELNTVREHRWKQENHLTLEDVKLLIGIRDRWHEFSMDDTQHAKARQAAFKFSQELRTVLKKHFA